jgi:hypothetical protein
VQHPLPHLRHSTHNQQPHSPTTKATVHTFCIYAPHRCGFCEQLPENLTPHKQWVAYIGLLSSLPGTPAGSGPRAPTSTSTVAGPLAWRAAKKRAHSADG